MGLIIKQNIYILAILYQDFTFLPWANYKQTCKKRVYFHQLAQLSYHPPSGTEL